MSRVLRELVEAVVLALIVFLVIQTSVRNFKVDGSSMHPTLEGGHYLMVNKLVYFQLDVDRLSRIVPFWEVYEPSARFAVHPPKRGEVIVFHFPKDTSKDFVKRVIGLPGELVEVRQGTVYIDDVPLNEPYIDGRDTSTAKQIRLRDDEYYVLGDNRGSSNDSRTWGPVSERHVLGKVWFVYWPISELRLLNDFSGAAHGLLR